MKSLLAPTEDFIIVERGILDADVSAGSSVTLPLINNDGWADNDYIVVGHRGKEKAELQQLNAAVSGSTDVQVATLKFDHKKGDPVFKYRYNQRKFYGATSATGTFSELTDDGSPIDIQVDDPQGSQLEYTGSEGFTHFKSTYYNSEEDLESPIADANVTEADESKRYTSLFAIRKHAGLSENMLIDDGRIEEKRKQAESEIDSCLFPRYVLPLSEIPHLITRIATLLAAGYIDFEEFGSDGEGVKWLGEARGLLNSIKKGTQKLLASDQTELEVKTSTTQVQGFPDNTIDEGSREDVQFKMKTRF